MQLYRPILKQAFQIIWRHKVLWFFGFFVGLLGSSGEYNLLISKTSDLSQQQTFLHQLSLFKESGVLETTWAGIKNLFITTTSGLIIVLITGLAVSAVLIFLFIVSQVALIKNTQQAQDKKPINLKYSFRIGKIHLWKALGLNVIYKITVFFSLGILGILFLLSSRASSGQDGFSPTIIVLFVVFVLLTISASFITRYALCYLVLKKQSFLKSLKGGLSLFFKNWLVSLEMAFVLFAINIIVGLALMLAILALALPFVLLISLALYLELKIAFWVLLVICLSLLLALIITLGSSLSGFQCVSWTLLFIQLSKAEGNLSKLVRLFGERNKRTALSKQEK